MPIHGIEFHDANLDEWVTDPPPPMDEDGQRFVGGPNGTFEFMYDSVPGPSWTPTRIENARQWIQANVFDFRIDRASLPADHPYIKDGDPALEWLFWDGTDVVERTIVIDSIILNENDLPRCELRRAHAPHVLSEGTD